VALSYIKGPCVDDWVAQEAQKVVTRVYGRPHDTLPVQATHQTDDEVLWNDFITDFTGTFADTASAKQGYANLTKPEMKGDEIDEYIAAFEYLSIRASWQGRKRVVRDVQTRPTKRLTLDNPPTRLNANHHRQMAGRLPTQSPTSQDGICQPGTARRDFLSTRQISDAIPRDDHRVGSLRETPMPWTSTWSRSERRRGPEAEGEMAEV